MRPGKQKLNGKQALRAETAQTTAGQITGRPGSLARGVRKKAS